jgi:hypothetical protein
MIAAKTPINGTITAHSPTGEIFSEYFFLIASLLFLSSLLLFQSVRGSERRLTTAPPIRPPAAVRVPLGARLEEIPIPSLKVLPKTFRLPPFTRYLSCLENTSAILVFNHCG